MASGLEWSNEFYDISMGTSRDDSRDNKSPDTNCGRQNVNTVVNIETDLNKPLNGNEDSGSLRSACEVQGRFAGNHGTEELATGVTVAKTSSPPDGY